MERRERRKEGTRRNAAVEVDLNNVEDEG
ncbi:uncharacterized protein G2W53_031049 [Senna tora]|uniref:Uncharacterized protein n=1 Tax=Senna tora TaxID=362788 RepID=A0A834T8J8_9FABA|nr:uncharacterized protein G2W53_031049 [Senna tora]